jgi:outer membrane receptor protein involved in Fe transport
MKKTIQNLIVLSVFISFSTNAAVLFSDGEIHGRIKSKEKAEPLEFVSVVAMVNDRVITSTSTDQNGYYSLKPLQPGNYTVKAVMMSYQPYQISEVSVNAGRTTLVNIELISSDEILTTTVIESFVHELIDPMQISTVQYIETKEIKNSPHTDVRDIVASAAGIIQREEGGELNVRGSRNDATQYVIDGVKVNGPFRIPKSAIKEIAVLTGGIPAMFGDATGGIIIITTKGYLGW